MELNINGALHEINAASSEETLLLILRNQLDLTGSKYGCGEGACGACTVLVDGKATRACITPASSTVGKKIITIEGLSKDGRLHPVQSACLNEDAFQCAYCASGMIMSAVSLLNKADRPSKAEIIEAMQGNICRCGTYPRIIRAIQKVSTV